MFDGLVNNIWKCFKNNLLVSVIAASTIPNLDINDSRAFEQGGKEVQTTWDGVVGIL